MKKCLCCKNVLQILTWTGENQMMEGETYVVPMIKNYDIRWSNHGELEEPSVVGDRGTKIIE